MTATDEDAIRLSRELSYYAGHGYNESNRWRYPTLLALPQIVGRLPMTATTAETADHLDAVLIETIRSHRSPVTFRYTGQVIPPESLQDYWTCLLGLPPYHRAKQLERHRCEVADELGAGSVATWRRRGGPEEELMAHLADRLLHPPGEVPSGRWVVRRSQLHYFIGPDRSIQRLDCRYDAETLADGVVSYGVDHRTSTGTKAADYYLVEGSTFGCDRIEHRRLMDRSLSLDLFFDDPLPRGTRRELGYALSMTTEPDRFQVLRLNAAVVVWEHDLTVTFNPEAIPDRVWWFSHHIGTGAGHEPTGRDYDLAVENLTVHQSFAGLREGPDYGIAFRWGPSDEGAHGDSVASIG
ncbi:MAG TPA: hypothetical protein VHB02_03850 [Acidimicrobiales bacterium]|nr:hypothetical protein [Acidimicrobiales bacterium]